MHLSGPTPTLILDERVSVMPRYGFRGLQDFERVVRLAASHSWLNRGYIQDPSPSTWSKAFVVKKKARRCALRRPWRWI